MDKNTRKTSFGKYLEPLNLISFYDDIEKNKLDKYAKKLFVRNYVMIFLYGILQKRESLRAISDDLLQEEFQRFLGLKSISYSQLSRRHNSLDPSLLSIVFLELVQRLQKPCTGSSIRKPNVRIIDSSTITLALNKYKWAEFRKTKSGIKLHLRLQFLDANTVIPDKLALTPAKHHDRTQMESLVDDDGCMYVFDRGYLDYRQFDSFCEKGIPFTTRVKRNTYIDEICPLDIPDGSHIFHDSIVVIGTKLTRMKHELRLVEFDDEQGRTLQILTNNLDMTAEEIADLYRSRWAIELFFKWMKQNLQIKHMYGTTEKAVWNQIYLTMISYCLLVLAKKESKSPFTLQVLKRRLLNLAWDFHIKWRSPLINKSD